MKNQPVQLLFILFTIILVSSCSKCEMILFGMKMPHLETQASLSNYMIKNSIDSTLTLVAKDTVAYEKLNNYLTDLSAILIFNKNGYLNVYADKRYCAGPVENYVGKICSASVMGIDSTKTEKELLSFVKPFTIQPLIVSNQKPDYSIYLTWSRWKNKVNNSIFRWHDLLEKQQGCKINIYYINTDQRAEHYGFTKRKRISVEAHGNKK